MERETRIFYKFTELFGVEVLLNSISEVTPYRKESTIFHHCKNQLFNLVSAVQKNSPSLQ
jgi:hypothetical protein